MTTSMLLGVGWILLFHALGIFSWNSNVYIPGYHAHHLHHQGKKVQSSQQLFASTSTDGSVVETSQDNMITTNINNDDNDMFLSSRRTWFQKALATASAITVATTATSRPAFAVELGTTAATAAEVTDKVYLDIKGLPTIAADGTTTTGTTKRIVIGLFGKEAPLSTQKLKQLVSTDGLPAPCRPKEERMLQREQLEANKVYNSCIENEEKGVNYDYSQIWRILEGERIDFGSVAGRFVAREYPVWEEEENNNNNKLKHDRPGIVSVRKGSDSGFGFTVYPGDGKSNTSDLNENHIVIGQVIEGMDVIEELNKVPVITSAKVNYMGLTGGPSTKSAPSRSCRYGGPMYCNENKPLIKLSVYKSGVVS